MVNHYQHFSQIMCTVGKKIIHVYFKWFVTQFKSNEVDETQSILLYHRENTYLAYVDLKIALTDTGGLDLGMDDLKCPVGKEQLHAFKNEIKYFEGK